MNLAMCHEIEGKTATAWTEFNEALASARKAARADREKAAREHLTALEPRLSHLTVTVPAGSAVAGLEIKLDGSAVEGKALGTAIAVDPGEHTATATAPGREPWQAKVTLKETEAQTLTVPALVSTAPPLPPAPPPATPWKRPAGIAAAGAGAVLLAVGAGFGAHAISPREPRRFLLPQPAVLAGGPLRRERRPQRRRRGQRHARGGRRAGGDRRGAPGPLVRGRAGCRRGAGRLVPGGGAF